MAVVPGIPQHSTSAIASPTPLARERNEPLLYVGDDFTHTDIRSALTRE